MSEQENMRIEVRQYVEKEVLPFYEGFDEAHQCSHAETVMARALDLAEYYPVNKEMVYVAAAYHDLGLCKGREKHHLVSGEILRADTALRVWFSSEDIETMAQAVEDHRASGKSEPRSIYGKIIAEADRLIEPEMVVRRTLQYGKGHYPHLHREAQFERALQHLREKYGPDGYLRLWIPESPNAEKIKDLHALIADEARLREMIERM